MEATKNIPCAKKGAVDASIVTRELKKFRSSYKKMDNQASSCGPKTVDSEGVLKAIETNRVSRTRRVSGEIGIIRLSIVCHLPNLSESLRNT